MLASKIQRNMMIDIDGLRLRVRDIGTDARGRVRMTTDAGTVRRRPDADVKVLAEVTAGPVAGRPVAQLRTVKGSDNRWRGQRDGTTQERIISYSRGWDA